MFDHDSANPNTTSWLVYNQKAPLPQPKLLSQFYDWDDTRFVPLKPMPVTMYDRVVTLDVNFTNIQGINRAIINNNTYYSPDVPAIFTALTTGLGAINPDYYGHTTNTHVLKHLDMVWLAINNLDNGGHPCIPPPSRFKLRLTDVLVHLHGHAFQVLYRSDSGNGTFDPDNLPEFPENPIRRDVLFINEGGYAIIAFRADNPGAWYVPLSCKPDY